MEEHVFFADIAPSSPFTGYVLNINVATRAHRDPKDLKGCVVLVVGDFEGSELVLYEPGLVMELHNGDASTLTQVGSLTTTYCTLVVEPL